MLANALWLDDELAEALSWARWATRALPGAEVHPMAWRALGNALLDLGRYEEAEQAYCRADPAEEDPGVCCNRSQVAQGQGQLGKAWRLAEARLLRSPPPEGVIPGPWWSGWPHVPAVTIWSEQGLGDTLQFVRWLPQLLAAGPAVTLLVDPPLRRLLAEGLGWMGPQLAVEARRHDPQQLPGCHGSLLSLPWLLNQAQPPQWGAEGYLRLQPNPAAPEARQPRVGLMWGAGRYLDGRAQERNYRRKSVLGKPLGSLLAALAARPIDLVKLQVGPDRHRPEQGNLSWADTLAADADFLDLARALQSLDLLISVDTAAAHLAGAMGQPTWVLLPWAAASRWRRNTARTPWYDSCTLWRQPRHGDWEGLWPQLLTALDGWISRWKRVS